MAGEQALEKKLEQTKWQFPNHVVFKHNGKVFHFDPNNFNEENIFTQTGLEVFKEKDGNVALYDPEYFKVGVIGNLVYKGTATEKIPQPINLKKYVYLFDRCECETIDLSDWDFSGVVSLRTMFYLSEIKVVNFGGANLSKCEDFGGCFSKCERLKELILGNYKLPQDVYVCRMFHNCDRLSRKYGKTEEELADIFKSGKWNSLQPVKKMGAFE